MAEAFFDLFFFGAGGDGAAVRGQGFFLRLCRAFWSWSGLSGGLNDDNAMERPGGGKPWLNCGPGSGHFAILSRTFWIEGPKMQSRGRPCQQNRARESQNHGMRIGGAFVLILFMTAAAPPGRGQRAETCNQSTVRKKSLMPVAQSAAEDIYANTTNSKGPLKGKVRVEELRKANLAERKNSKPAVFSPDTIVTSKAGDMAYDYGKARVEYDLASTGQHIAYDVEYLRVWKVNGGICQVEGIFSRPDKLADINK